MSHQPRLAARRRVPPSLDASRWSCRSRSPSLRKPTLPKRSSHPSSLPGSQIRSPEKLQETRFRSGQYKQGHSLLLGRDEFLRRSGDVDLSASGLFPPGPVLRELPKAKVLAWKPDNADFVDVTSTGTDARRAARWLERQVGLPKPLEKP
jgi:hypothetical protein